MSAAPSSRLLVMSPTTPPSALIEIDSLSAGLTERLAAVLSGAYQVTVFDWILVAAYFAVMSLLSVWGLHRYQLIYLYRKHQDQAVGPPARQFDRLPKVTVQLPVYNEPYVVENLIETVCRLDYPRELLQIQVLDDSTDETSTIARAAVERLAAQGNPIEHLRRPHRRGYKAGALQAGLAAARGELIAIFDADFSPRPDFLHQTVHYFSDPRDRHGASSLDVSQSRSVAAHAFASSSARWAFRLRARRAVPLRALLQLQRNRRRIAPVDDRRRGRLAARHPHRRHRPELPGPDEGLALSLPGARRGAVRVAARHGLVPNAASSLGERIDPNREEDAAGARALGLARENQVGGMLSPGLQSVFPADDSVVAVAAAIGADSLPPRRRTLALLGHTVVLRYLRLALLVLPARSKRAFPRGNGRRPFCCCRGCRPSVSA